MNKTILVIEDENSIFTALRDKLVRENFTVYEAKNGEEGLAMALSKHPDLILLDIIMPRMDGITMLKKLRVDTWGHSARVILLTNLSDNKDIDEAMDNKAVMYLIKSDWDINEILAKIKENLN